MVSLYAMRLQELSCTIFGRVIWCWQEEQKEGSDAAQERFKQEDDQSQHQRDDALWTSTKAGYCRSLVAGEKVEAQRRDALPRMILRMPYNGQWIVLSEDELATRLKSSKPEVVRCAKWFDTTYHDSYLKNPVAYFLAHGGGVDYINDRTSRMCMLTSGVQCGKTTALLAKLALRAVPTSPDWPVYKYGKIKYVPWEGSIRMMMASYEWHHVRTNLWPKLCELLPVDELREYSPKWKSAMARRKFKTVSEHSPCCKLSCGTTIDVFCYRSPPECFTSTTYQGGGFLDEQPPQHVISGLFDRGQNSATFQLNVSCTPEQLPGCAWTGAGSWIQKAWDGIDTMGMTIGRYKIDRKDIPLAIVDEEARARIYYKHITYPLSTGNQRAIRSGHSHYYGTFESSEGLVYDNWMPGVHWITPFDIPPHWTHYRAIDPGRVDPTCALWAAISPWGDCILYRCYYEAGLGIRDNAKNIIKASGNSIQQIEPDYAVEEFAGETYGFTVMDPRTHASPSQDAGRTLGEVWASYGLSSSAASGKRNDVAIPMVKEWMELIPGHTHILVRMGIQKEVMGADLKPMTSAPRFYVFNTLTPFREEIEAYINKADKPNEPADKQRDHAMTCMKYLLLEGPRYLGPTAAQLNPTLPVETTLQSILKYTSPKKRRLYEYH